METSYREWEKRRQEHGSGRRTASGRKRGGGVSLGTREKRRLVQLAICLVLFLGVFIGKGIFPDQMVQFRDKTLELIRSDTDFKAVFASLGRSISSGEPVLDTLEGLWIEVFGGGEGITVTSMDLEKAALYQRQTEALTSGTTTMAARFGIPMPADQDAEKTEEPEVQEETEPEPTPEAEPAVVHVDYEGPALPDNATMDKYNLDVLGVGETVTPALGWVTSDFGWREHPVDGGEKFHNGVDLGVNTGTPVLAFAGGVVDYIGESDIYGQYLQIRHEGGLTSFYAHCSKLCVQQGQTVAAGEKVAESGATGNATGPHLHFELKLDGVLLNPTYYIETT